MNQQKFTKEEFVEQCSKRGYVWASEGGKNAVRKWCKSNPKDIYTEADMLELYRYFDKRRGRNEYRPDKYDSSWTRDPM